MRNIPWPVERDPAGNLDAAIDEDWLRENGFRIESGRNDSRLPVRRLAVGWHLVHGREWMSDSTDLCIDVAPVQPRHEGRWYVWLMQEEPYRHIHVRHMRYRWEIVRLYEGLTGRCWPGTR